MHASAVPSAKWKTDAPVISTRAAVTVISDAVEVAVPGWVTNLPTFLDWADSDIYPEKGRICWLHGDVWIDTTMEQLFTHSLVKTKVATVVGMLCEQNDLGLYFCDGAMVVNEAADVGAIPDGVFLSHAGIEDGRVRFAEGKKGGHVSIVGTPDLVVEILSDSSVKKDAIVLRQSYWEAGIREYWLIDARAEPVRFEILKHTARGYTSIRPKAGWLPSPTFGKSFRFVAKPTKGSTPQFAFEMK